MIRVFFDTNAYAAFKNGDEGTIEVIRYANAIGIRAFVLRSLLAGFAVGTKAQTNLHELNAFFDSSPIRVCPFNHDTTAYYALIYKQLRIKRRRVPQNDLWIAAGCTQEGFRLLTAD